MRFMVDISDFIMRNFLVDLLLLGGRFTWFNGRARSAMSKLDRFIVSTEWDEHFTHENQPT